MSPRLPFFFRSFGHCGVFFRGFSLAKVSSLMVYSAPALRFSKERPIVFVFQTRGENITSRFWPSVRLEKDTRQTRRSLLRDVSVSKTYFKSDSKENFFSFLSIYASRLRLTAARDQLAASPPPPDQLTVLASNSTAVTLRWNPPALASRKSVRYTVRCTPVGTRSAAAIRYLQV